MEKELEFVFYYESSCMCSKGAGGHVSKIDISVFGCPSSYTTYRGNECWVWIAIVQNYKVMESDIDWTIICHVLIEACSKELQIS